MKKFLAVFLVVFRTLKLLFIIVYLLTALYAAYGLWLYFGGRAHP